MAEQYHQSAMVKLGARLGAYLGVSTDKLDHLGVTNDLMGVRVGAGRVTAIGGKTDGAILEDLIVEANQLVVIEPSIPIEPYRYHMIVTINTELLRCGSVCAPTIVAPGHGKDLIVSFRAAKKTDLKSLDFVFELYMLD